MVYLFTQPQWVMGEEVHQSQKKPEFRGRLMYISIYDLRQSLASGPPF